jgi:hypothetical protein
MAHEVMGYAVSPDAITMTAPASRQYVAMERCKQWHVRFSIGSPASSVANYRKQESLVSQAIDFPTHDFQVLP